MRKYSDVKIVIYEEEIDKLSKKEEFKRFHIYDEVLATVLMEKKSVTLNKPRYIDSAFLALSKTVMYEFHYKYMMKKFSECKLLFTDTDLSAIAFLGWKMFMLKSRVVIGLTFQTSQNITQTLMWTTR